MSLFKDFKQIVQIALNVDAIRDSTPDYFIKRYGLNNTPPKTLQQIGNEMGCSREYVRQLVNLALDDLKYFIKSSPTYSGTFTDLVNSLRKFLLIEESRCITLMQEIEGDLNDEDVPFVYLLLDMIKAKIAHKYVYFMWDHMPSYDSCVKIRNKIIRLLNDQPEYYTINSIAHKINFTAVTDPKIVKKIIDGISPIKCTEEGLYYIPTEDLNTIESHIYRVLHENGTKMRKEVIFEKIKKYIKSRKMVFNITGKKYVDSIGKTGYWVLRKWNIDTRDMVDTITDVLKNSNNTPIPVNTLCDMVCKIRSDIVPNTVKSYIYTCYRDKFNITDNKVSIK